MKHKSFASVSFDVGHASPNPPGCAKPHGHRVNVVVGFYGSPIKEWGSYTVPMEGVAQELYEIQHELQHRSLNDMIAPANPTSAGLAAWVWERFALHYPTLCYVEVEMAGITHTIETE